MNFPSIKGLPHGTTHTNQKRKRNLKFSSAKFDTWQNLKFDTDFNSANSGCPASLLSDQTLAKFSLTLQNPELL